VNSYRRHFALTDRCAHPVMPTQDGVHDCASFQSTCSWMAGLRPMSAKIDCVAAGLLAMAGLQPASYPGSMCAIRQNVRLRLGVDCGLQAGDVESKLIQPHPADLRRHDRGTLVDVLKQEISAEQRGGDHTSRVHAFTPLPLTLRVLTSPVSGRGIFAGR
jgi:hypothetical protein